MNRRLHGLAGIVMALTLVVGAAAVGADSRPTSDFSQTATWQTPSSKAVHEQVVAWLAERQLPDDERAQLDALWNSALQEDAPAYLLDVLVATLAAADPQARQLVASCAQPRQPGALPAVDWLAADSVAPLERDNLRLFYVRWLVQETLYDEAAEALQPLKPESVVDPAALLFYQAVVCHRTLRRDEGLAAISRLLENEPTLPRRYVSLAKLIQADLEPLKDESLDHIARRMDDIRRRLDLGRAGPKVRAVEDGVIASLDKLIEEMEKQQQAAAAAAAAAGGGGGGSMRPTKPAEDSTPMGGKGPGEVAKKSIGNESGWGDLPPRARQEALQQIGKDFPAHYRDMIEQYFRKLASEPADKPDK